MNGNPFYVHPGGDYSQGLAGLGQTMMQVGEIKRREKAEEEKTRIADEAAKKTADIRKKMSDAWQARDNRLLEKVMDEHPEAAEAMNMYDRQTHRDKETYQNSIEATREFYLDPTVETAQRLAARTKELHRLKGMGPEETVQTDAFIEKALSDPLAARDDAERRLIAADNPWFKQQKEMMEKEESDAFGKSTTDLASYVQLEKQKWLNENPGKTEKDVPPQVLQDAFIAAKRAQPEEARSVAAAQEAGRLSTQLKLKPQVEAAVKSAVSEAASIVAKEGEQLDNDKVFSIYTTAMDGLAQSLSETTTGPFMGYIPAITDNQQIADGASAAMAPVLKAIFREAGEGTFTKDDQEILMAMLPSRNDSAGARVAKLKNVDAIVRAKLGQPLLGGSEQPQRENQQPAYKDGQKARLPDGQMVIFRNGRWEPM